MIMRDVGDGIIHTGLGIKPDPYVAINDKGQDKDDQNDDALDDYLHLKCRLDANVRKKNGLSHATQSS
jgi:hypothetical protein